MKDWIKENCLACMLILVTMIASYFFQVNGMKSYSRYNSETLSYDKGTVVEVLEHNLSHDQLLNIDIGTQIVKVKMTSGKLKGKEIEVTNYVTKTHQVPLHSHDRIIVNVDHPNGMDPYFTIYNYDRSQTIWMCSTLLCILVIIIGKAKGLQAMIGLGYSMYLIVSILLPMIFSGLSPILVSIGCAFLATSVTLLLLNGQSEKTMAAIVSTMMGVTLSLLSFIAMAFFMHLNGFSSEEADSLIMIAESTGLHVKDILFVGILICSLGAIMDVCMSIVSALYEVYYHNYSLTRKDLFRSGMEIGKDMIGTMCNTLILAFTGSAFVTLLVFLSYQVEYNQFLNSNFLGIEIAQGLCGTIGIVLSVPLASYFASWFLTKEKYHKTF